MSDPNPRAADPSTNATTHGLTARRPLCEVEHERMQVIYNDWVTNLHPETEAEEALVATAAIEYVRYIRCVKAEEARLKPASREAISAWREKKQHAARKLAQGLANDPGRVVAELEESAFGIDWLIRHWAKLLAMINAGQSPTGVDFDRAVNLMGFPALAARTPGTEVAFLWDNADAAFPWIRLSSPPGAQSDPAAVARLKSFIAGKIGRLEAIRPVVWESVEAEELDWVEAEATVDISKEGQLRHRYRRDAQRDSQRSLTQLDRLRAERSKLNARESRQMAQSSSSQASRPAWTAAKPAETSPAPSASSRSWFVEDRPSTSPRPEPAHSPNEPRNPSSPDGQIRPNLKFSNTIRDAVDRLSPSNDGRTGGRTEGRTGETSNPDSPSLCPADRPESAPNHSGDAPDPR